MKQSIDAQIRCEISNNPESYEGYLKLADYYFDTNMQLAYLCLENALFYCDNQEVSDSIADTLGELITAGVYVRPASFIILSYNNLEFTKLCLESIRRTVPQSARDIIIVDNASTDGSVEYLKEQQDIKLICNDRNEGFPKGCNQGIEASDPNTDIFLLNNDTIMLPNSLFWLRMGLYSDASYASAGAMSNHKTNQQWEEESQKFDLSTSEGFDGIYEYGMSVNLPMDNPYEEKIYLIGFALLIKREAVNSIGILDESFTPGNFEDVDYGIRVLKAGMKNVLCHNSFIIHFGATSFNKDRHAYLELLHTNRMKLKDKWGFDIEYYKNARMDLIGTIKESPDRALNVLELGCGLGATAAKIKYLYPNSQVYGVDICDEVIEIANSFAEVQQADVENFDWPWQENFFDYVVMGDVLEHLRYPDRILQKLHKLVKNGGHIILSMPNVMHYSVMIPLLTEGIFPYASEGILDTTHLKMYTKKEIEKLIDSAGFEVEGIMYSKPIEPNEAQQAIIDKLVGLMNEKDETQFLAYQYMYKARRID